CSSRNTSNDSATSDSYILNCISTYTELSLTTVGQRVRLADMTILVIQAFSTLGLCGKIKQIAIDANGYEIFSSPVTMGGVMDAYKWSENLSYPAAGQTWVALTNKTARNLLFDPPKKTDRFAPLKPV